MDIATLIGIVAGFALIGGSMALGGSIAAFFNVAGLLIVVGGTFAASLINESLSHVLGAVRVAMQAFFDRRSASDRMIRHSVVVGRKDSDMPAFGNGKLSDAEIDDVVAYVRSFEQQAKAPEPLDPDERPTHVYESPYDFDTTLQNVKEALSGANFRTFPDRFVEQGLIDEFSVNTRQIGIRFCNFNVLYGMLKIEPRLGIVLPCRITVLEREDGSVILTVPNLRVVARWFNNDELVDLWDQMEESFVEIVEEATL